MHWTRHTAVTLALASTVVSWDVRAEPPGKAPVMGSPPTVIRVTSIASGQVVDSPAGPALGGVVVLDTMTNEGSAASLNVAYSDPRSYSGESSSTIAFAIGLAERLVFRAPMDQSRGLPLPTDILWNDYACDMARWPGGATAALQSFGFIPYFQNTEIPLIARTHTLRVEFFSVDRSTSHGGFEAEFSVLPGQTGYAGVTIDLSMLSPPVMAPANGWVMVDWVEPNNSGVGCMFTGGDLQNPGYPRPETLWTVGAMDPQTWVFADGVTGMGGPPERVDAGFDGDPGSVSYLDVLNTGALADWQFTVGSPPELLLAHDFACRLVLRGGPPACPCDVNGSGDLNSQDFFDFIAAFFDGEADFDGSGETNSQDLFDFLVCFFGSC